MKPTNRKQTQANYDKLSRWYDWLAGPGEAKAHHAALALLNVQPGERILEIGFGTGSSLITLAQAVRPDGAAFGIDLSTGMCQVAQGKIKQTTLENTHLCQADALALPFRAHSFDAVFMSFTLELLTDGEIPHVLQKCKKMLAANGRICITAISKQTQAGVVMKLYQWAHKQSPHIVDCRPIFVEQVVADAGFQITQLRILSLWGLPVEIVLGRQNTID